MAATFLAIDMASGWSFDATIRLALIAVLVASTAAHIALRLALKQWFPGTFTDAQDPMRD